LKKIKVVKLKNTCEVCPSQWEGVTDNNEPIYIRFRWNILSVRIGKKGVDIEDAVRGQIIFSKDSVTYNEYQGYMNYMQLRYLTRKILTLPNDVR